MNNHVSLTSNCDCVACDCSSVSESCKCVSESFIDTSCIETFVNTFESFEEFKKAINVLPNLGISIREDKDFPNLYLVSSKENFTKLQNECNGLIFEKETNKIVCMATNKFNKLNMDQFDCSLAGCDIEYCEDGTVIRLYNYNDYWYTATANCINANKSYWKNSDHTFNDMFWNILQTEPSGKFDLTNLDKSYTYSFIIMHTDNRIVIEHKSNELVYINRINNITKEEDSTNYFTDSKIIKKVEKIYNTESLDLHELINMYTNSSKRGFIIKCREGNSIIRFQYDFNKYSEIKDIRGNVPLIRMRYLELLNEPEKLRMLEEYYPENFMLFTMIKHCMDNLYKIVHKTYFQSHIKHNITIEESHKLYKTLRQLHGQYKKTGTIITLDEVTKKINTLDTRIIKSLLNWV